MFTEVEELTQSVSMRPTWTFGASTCSGCTFLLVLVIVIDGCRTSMENPIGIRLLVVRLWSNRDHGEGWSRMIRFVRSRIEHEHEHEHRCTEHDAIVGRKSWIKQEGIVGTGAL
jgi:hypothetical protein